MKVINIDDVNSGKKLDNFILSKYSITFSNLQKFLRQKDIKVNDQKVKNNYVLEIQDKIIINDFCLKILENNIKENTVKKKNQNVNKNLLELVKNSIIFEDEKVLVINKPQGLSVQGGTGIETSLDDLLPYIVDGNDNLKLVHRLDKDTSGVLIIAKNENIAELLAKEFKTKKNIEKEYLAIVDGKFNKLEDTINLPLIKKYENKIEKVYVDKIAGKEAITEYKVLKYNKSLNASLVLVKILTGRTHQIRVHLKEIGHSVIGDFKYGKLESKKISRKMLLHAYRIKLDFLDKKYVFETKIPDTFYDVLGKDLKQNQKF